MELRFTQASTGDKLDFRFQRGTDHDRLTPRNASSAVTVTLRDQALG